MLVSLERLLRWTTGLMAAAALFAIMWLTVVDVTGRRFFSHSVPGGLELTEMLMVVVIFGALPLVSWRSEHVVFDSFDGFLSERFKAVQARLCWKLCKTWALQCQCWWWALKMNLPSMVTRKS